MIKKTTILSLIISTLFLNSCAIGYSVDKTFTPLSTVNCDTTPENVTLFFEGEKIDFEYIFKIIRVWQFPSTDLKIIKDDWELIVSKIRQGKAHELSEGDTIYLGACTKGANKNSVVEQPFSNQKAMKRAFSLKSKYLKFSISLLISLFAVYLLKTGLLILSFQKTFGQKPTENTNPLK